jgi:hypothetical protein
MKRIKTFLLPGVVAVGLFAIIGASPALAAKGGGTTSASCPKGGAGLQPDPNVGAAAVQNGNITTYSLFSNDQGSSGGVPGLVKYCVYPKVATGAPDATATYDSWTAATSNKKPYNFSFSRPGGNETNVPFDADGKVTVIGTADWTDSLPVPVNQEIVLHVADPSLCNTNSGTCFVQPSLQSRCDAGAGNASAAYNSIPFGFPKCTPPPSFAFEGNFASEFGDGVKLNTTAGTTLKSMTVDFQSYGCGTSGHWNTGDCVTTGNQTFTIPDTGGHPGSGGITAHIYTVTPAGAVVAEIASARNTDAIPFRPTADPTCTDHTSTGGTNDVGKFVGPAGVCVNSLSVPITFTNFTAPGGGSPPPFSNGQQVIWTVSFDTTNAGFWPIGDPPPNCRTANSGDPGCGYDSLNVGTRTYPFSPYAGTDVTLSDSAPTHKSYVNYNSAAGVPSTPGNLVEEDNGSCPSPGCIPPITAHDLKPLATIVTGPAAP